MKRLFLCLIATFFAITGCQKKESKVAQENCQKPKKLAMYQHSEMALLMEQMAVQHQQVRKKLTEGKAVGAFPAYYEKILSAKMTDPTDFDADFKTKAAEFLAAEKAFYQQPNKDHYNAGVQACLSCHELKCGGPIPKIKKLIWR
jgi:cytochrome c553